MKGQKLLLTDVCHSIKIGELLVLKRISANCSTTMSSINRLYPTEFVYASIFLKGQKGAESGMTEQAPTVPRQRHRPPDATENNNAHHGTAAETSPTYSSFKEPADSKEVLLGKIASLQFTTGCTLCCRISYPQINITLCILSYGEGLGN